VKAVILAAGKSTRTEPLTVNKPKPLLKVANKEIIRHTLDMLTDVVEEVIIVVGYKKDMITGLIGDRYNGVRVSYVEQTEQLGTGHALSIVKDHIDDDFVLVGGDDIFSKEDFIKIAKEDFAVLAKKVDNPSDYGVLVEKDGILASIVEKPKEFVSDLVSTGCFKLKKDIFDYLDDLKRSERGEIEFVDAISKIMGKEKIRVIETDSWVPVTFAWNLLDANEYLMKGIKRDIRGIVEDNVTLKGDVVVGEGTIVRSGSYIEGPVIIGKDCRIGPNCYIRPNSSIGNGCHIGQGVEVKNIILGNNSNIPHLNYVGDSVIGENCNLGAGTIVANLRHDNLHHRTMIKGKLIDTKRRKFGTIMADGVHTGINTSIYPGRKFWPDTSTVPGEIVKKDKVE